MNPELTGLAIVVLVLIFILSTWYGRARKRPQGPDVGVAVFVDEVDEDINNPSLATIDEALRHVDRDSNPDAVDWLLERRMAAMRKVEASWPSI